MSKREITETELRSIEERLEKLKPQPEERLAENILNRLERTERLSLLNGSTRKKFLPFVYSGLGFIAGAVVMFFMMNLFSGTEIASNETPEEIIPKVVIAPIEQPPLEPEKPPIKEVVAKTPPAPEPMKKEEEKNVRETFLALKNMFARLRENRPEDLDTFIARREALAKEAKTSAPRLRYVILENPRSKPLTRDYYKTLQRELECFPM